METRTKEFQNVVVHTLKDVSKRLKHLEHSSKGSEAKLEKLEEAVKEIEVEHILDKAADSEKSTYWQAETRKVIVTWFPERKFLYAIPLLELATEAKKECSSIDPERLSLLDTFKDYTLGVLRNERYIFTNNVNSDLYTLYPKLVKLNIEEYLGKGRRTGGTTVQKKEKADRHEIRNKIWKTMKLTEGETVKAHAEVILKQLQEVESNADWTQSDKALARIAVEHFLRVKVLTKVETRFKAIMEINGRNEDDPDQLCFEYSEDETEDDKEAEDKGNDEADK
eukprot:Phypoly_transcript_13971.p1 GENE.Phypoly_transcript_13971~~Phypoly_transcript_13971.p1  ORF type:complete len:330 (+),score=59.63 Phypoly_transcript_13971:148-990(+)